MKKSYLVLIALVVLMLAGVGYVLLYNRNSEGSATQHVLPTYYLMTQTITSTESSHFLNGTDVQTIKVQNGAKMNISQIRNAGFTNPFETEDGHKIFVTESEDLGYYVLTGAGALSQLAVDPFSEQVTFAGYVVRGKTSSPIPAVVRNGASEAIDVLAIGQGTTKTFLPETYGGFTFMKYLGISDDASYIYFFVGNGYPDSSTLKTAIVKQSLFSDTDFALLVSADAGNDQFATPLEALEILGTTKNTVYFSHYTNQPEQTYEQGENDVQALQFSDGTIDTLIPSLGANYFIKLNQDRTLLVAQNESAVAEEPIAKIYSLSTGELIRTAHPQTCRVLDVDQSGRYVAQICDSIGEYQIVDTLNNTKTTISEFERPIDGVYEIEYSETSFLMFEYSQL